MKIYSYDLIDEEILNQDHHIQNDQGFDVSFTINYDARLTVNMEFKGKGQLGVNAQGWHRDLSFYFSTLLDNHPEAFSERNKRLISDRRAPFCDDIFTSYFDVYKGYEGNKLVHHHIGSDGQVIALPQDLHVGSGGVHIAENKVGIVSLTRTFSDRVQSDFDNGVVFSWDNANEYYTQIAEELKQIETQSVNNEDRIEPSANIEPDSQDKPAYGDTVATNRDTHSSSISDDLCKAKILAGDLTVGQKIIGSFNKIRLKVPMKALLKVGAIGLGFVGIVVAAKNPEKTKYAVNRGVELLGKLITEMHITPETADSNENIDMDMIMNMNMEETIADINDDTTVEEAIADINDDTTVEEAIAKERSSPVRHQVNGYNKKDGTHVKSHPRGGKSKSC